MFLFILENAVILESYKFSMCNWKQWSESSLPTLDPELLEVNKKKLLLFSIMNLGSEWLLFLHCLLEKIYFLEVVGKDRELRREGVIGLLSQMILIGG